MLDIFQLSAPQLKFLRFGVTLALIDLVLQSHSQRIELQQLFIRLTDIPMVQRKNVLDLIGIIRVFFIWKTGPGENDPNPTFIVIEGMFGALFVRIVLNGDFSVLFLVGF